MPRTPSNKSDPRSPAVVRRDARVNALHAKGLSMKEVARRVGITDDTVARILARKGAPPPVYKGYAERRARYDRALELYKQGKTIGEIVRRVGLPEYAVRDGLDRRGILRRDTSTRERPPTRAQERLLAKVKSVAHLYDTGPGTSAKDLAKRVGITSAALLRQLHLLGVKVRVAGGRAVHLPDETFARIKKELTTNTKLSFAKVARKHGVSTATVKNIVKGSAGAHVPWPAPYLRRPKKKLTPKQVQEIRIAVARDREEFAVVAKRYGVEGTTVYGIVTGVTWKTLAWPKGVKYQRRRPPFKRRVGWKTITPQQAAEIKAALLKEDLTFRELGEKYGMNAAGIAAIAMGRTWKKVPWPGGKKYKRRVPFLGKPRSALSGVIRREGSTLDTQGGERWKSER